MAQDGVFFKRMAVIHPKWRTPAFSLIGQGAWAAILTLSGRYDQLYTYVIFGMVLSYTLTVIALFILRWKRPDIPRPYRCAGYPWLARNLCAGRRGLDVEHDHHASARSFLGDSDRADRRARVFVLEAEREERNVCLSGIEKAT